MHHLIRGAALGALLLASSALAVDISVVGIFPGKAVVMVNGGVPRTVTVGQKLAEGATLVGVERDSATFDLGGKKKSIRIGEAQSSQRGSANPSVTLSADTRGQYPADGQINGQPVRFMVDTGATFVALSSGDARRLGIDYLAGQPVTMNTANGFARGWRVKLDSVRVGDISVNAVDAVIAENQTMPVLLGMSFLNRMDMRREGTQMTLTKRY
jgi:aspartyl protease family protein